MTPSAEDRRQAVEVTARLVLWRFSSEKAPDGSGERIDVAARVLGRGRSQT